MSIPWALAVPVIAFIAVIGPLWIIGHYITVWKRIKAGELGNGQVTVTKRDLKQFRDSAERLEQRLESLETILDAEFPNWRSK